MTKLILDPDTIKAELPQASVSNVFRVRLLVQVLEYDEMSANLTVRKIPNIPSNAIMIDDSDDEEVAEPTLVVDLAHIVESLKLEVTTPGSIVNITGFYDGADVNPVECYAVHTGSLASKSSLNRLIQFSRLKPLE